MVRRPEIQDNSIENFELYTELEYLFDSGANENNYCYQWTDITYSPNDWLSVGISGQRTRLYQTNLDIQRGLFAGASLKNWELTSLPFRGALVALVTNDRQQCGAEPEEFGRYPHILQFTQDKK